MRVSLARSGVEGLDVVLRQRRADEARLHEIGKVFDRENPSLCYRYNSLSTSANSLRAAMLHIWMAEAVVAGPISGKNPRACGEAHR